MITDRDIEQSDKQRAQKADTYLNGITEFVKWTSTLAVAAVLWVASGLVGQLGWAWALSMTSLGLLLAALAAAVLALHRVLRAWSWDWRQACELDRFYLLKEFKYHEPERVSQEQERDQIDRLIHSIDGRRGYDRPERFNRWVLAHLGLLLAALLAYVVSRGLG
jgi:hypothetical protein